jgi:hypothetical protein
MNERIKELAKQAGMWRQHYDIGEESPSNLEEFAELIVQECVTICEQQRTKILQNPSDPSWTEHLAEVQNNIKQHFGV